MLFNFNKCSCLYKGDSLSFDQRSVSYNFNEIFLWSLSVVKASSIGIFPKLCTTLQVQINKNQNLHFSKMKLKHYFQLCAVFFLQFTFYQVQTAYEFSNLSFHQKST